MLKNAVDILETCRYYGGVERIIHSPFSKEKIDFELTPRQREEYFDLAAVDAREAKAYPSQSGYYVRTAGLAKDGTLCTGGNKEYAHSDAFVHGETAVVSSLRDLTEAPIEAVAWHREKKAGVVGPENFGRPCGNCRDVLLHYTSPELVLLNGNDTGVVYTRLKDFLFEDFHYLDSFSVRELEVEEALAAKEAGIDVYLPEGMKPKAYGVALVSEDGTIWRGSLYTNAGYDAVTPIQSAVLSWWNSYPTGKVSGRHLNLARVVVAAKDNVPSPFYRDRQVLLELDEILRRHRGDEKPLEVQLINYSNQVSFAFKTNAVEFLPRPFTPGAFRMDDIIFAEMAKLVGLQEAKKVFEREQK